jgi:carbonic anhydrase/acetyltransferase-like protein (isoleucine patch superfamily)
MKEPTIVAYHGKRPHFEERVYVAPSASIIGDVTVGEDSSLWFGAVLRGDVQPITVGPRTSIQDNSVIHATDGWVPTLVGADVTVGHMVILHGCTIEDRVLVGMGSIIMDEATVGTDTIIGAGSLITAKQKIPSGVLALGRPAKVIRELREEELRQIRDSAAHYVAKGHEYLNVL